MPTETGCYVFTSNNRHNGHNGLPLQRSSDLYNQDYAPDEQWPNHLVNIFADEASS